MATQNKQIPVIVLYASHERGVVEHNTQYLVVHDADGTIHKISEKRQDLWELFNGATTNHAYIFVYEEFTPNDSKTPIRYVADVRDIVDPINQIAVSNMALKLADRAGDERNRSTALSYAKDLECADKITAAERYQTAWDNFLFIKGEWKPQEVK